jgi:hypothetical protein
LNWTAKLFINKPKVLRGVTVFPKQREALGTTVGERRKTSEYYETEKEDAQRVQNRS